MSHDHLCFAADVVDMAVHGVLHIHEGGSGDTDGWRLVRVPGADRSTLQDSQRALAAKLFADGDEIVLKNTEVAALSGGAGLPAMVIIGVMVLATHSFFAFLLKASTTEGRTLLNAIEGLRLYLSVAERDELKSLKGPGGTNDEPVLDAERYEALLPYAMALDVEKAWAGKFIRAVGESTAREATPAWHHGRSKVGTMGLAGMGASLSSALTSEISSAAAGVVGVEPPTVCIHPSATLTTSSLRFQRRVMWCKPSSRHILFLDS